MELTIVKTTPAELTGDARIIVALSGKPFTFLGFRGKVLMNRNMKGIRKLTAALETMWKHDNMLTQEAMDEVDEAYDIIKQTAGDHAAHEAWDAWRRAAEESRKKKAKAAALAWIEAGSDDLDEHAWDVLYELGYDRDFVDHGLHDAYSELHDQHRDRPRYRNYLENWAHAAFIYGFQMGQRAADRMKEAAAV